ncbi:hypothetical protein JOB18_030977 [Solea senegalensis]|uniref:C2H2-type domain-containing protein n=1 Tax=Solea senegalensis TaxID=28829 RepID=A0AAV6PLF8_SOLSE|nr:hypothetical protein JOB18_030977 [Solea senegalensis]
MDGISWSTARAPESFSRSRTAPGTLSRLANFIARAETKQPAQNQGEDTPHLPMCACPECGKGFTYVTDMLNHQEGLAPQIWTACGTSPFTASLTSCAVVSTLVLRVGEASARNKLCCSISRLAALNFHPAQLKLMPEAFQIILLVLLRETRAALILQMPQGRAAEASVRHTSSQEASTPRTARNATNRPATLRGHGDKGPKEKAQMGKQEKHETSM